MVGTQQHLLCRLEPFLAPAAAARTEAAAAASAAVAHGGLEAEPAAARRAMSPGRRMSDGGVGLVSSALRRASSPRRTSSPLRRGDPGVAEPGAGGHARGRRGGARPQSDI